jgi:hypothetical protein
MSHPSNPQPRAHIFTPMTRKGPCRGMHPGSIPDSGKEDVAKKGGVMTKKQTRANKREPAKLTPDGVDRQV